MQRSAVQLRQLSGLGSTDGSFEDRKLKATAHWRATSPTRGTPTPPGVSSFSVSADYHLRSENQYWYLIELARYFWDNDPIYSTAIARIADNVIGEGFTVCPETGISELDDFLKADWEYYSEHPEKSDSAQQFCLDHRAYMEFCATLNDGDVFNVPRSNGAVQSLESHRCRSSRGTQKNVLLGVECDDEGVRVRYWFTKTANDITYDPRINEIAQVEARDSQGHRRVWHYYLPKRMSQRRGVSVIAPVAEYVQMHSDIQYAKLMQQQAASAYATIHELPTEAFERMNPNLQAKVLEALDVTQQFPEENLRAGINYWAKFPGEKISGFSPNIPNPEYFQHVLMILQIVAVNIGIPVAVLLLDASQTNFSGWRGSLDEARRGFCRLQCCWGIPWYRDKYEWRVRWLAANSKKFKDILRAANLDLTDPGAEATILQAEIHPPRWRYIEPNKDIDARVKEVGNHFSSPRQDAAQWGTDFDDIVEQTIADNDGAMRLAADAALQFNADYPDLVNPPTWRDFWQPVRASGSTMSESTNVGQQISGTDNPTNTGAGK